MVKNFSQSKSVRWGLIILLTLALVFGASVPFFMSVSAADVTDGLDVKIIAAPNFVVDSNVSSPSTYAPRVATVIGEFCNTGNTTLTNVTGYIGNFGTTTPGTYPSRGTADAGFDAEHPDLAGTGPYAFSHLGGSADATRYVGSLDPGQCGYQYWHFTYPACENSEEPPCSADPVWGATNDPNDDLWLNFDVWGTASGGITNADNETHTARMRNEISAMANKIEPNGNPGGTWFNTDTSTVNPGQTITTNGILYRLGNIRKGFDNNNDGVPDYNAWLQPFGDPTYDPSCFRLVQTTGVVTVTTNTGDVIIPFKDNLYFTDLPQNNTNVVGEVFYEFLALGGACTIPISPYQEAASGFDNEKFNGDYGAGPAPLQTFKPSVTIDKTGSPAAGATGAQVDYQIDFINNSTEADAGIVLSSGAGGTIGLVISDTVPAGMTYIANSASAGNSIPTGNSVSLRYSTDSGATWTDGDLGINTASAAPSNLVKIQWWFDEPLEKAGASNNSGYVTFSANLPGTAPTPPFVENCADGSFADAAAFATTCTVTMIEGSNEIGDFVWWDANSDGIQDGGESGIDGVTVSLYYDKNGDGAFDDGDIFITTTQTSGGGAYSFTNLANGDFIVVVDDQDTDITNNRLVPTTTTEYGVTGLGTTITSPYLYADFGFGPVLSMNKTLSSSNPVYEGENVVWTIDLVNTLPGDGTGQPSTCSLTNVFWANSGSLVRGAWVTPENAYNTNELDGLYADSAFGGNDDDLRANPILTGQQSGSIASVEAIYMLYLDTSGGTLTGDDIEGNIHINTTGNASPVLQNVFDRATLNAASSPTLFSFDATSLETADGWQWSDFSKYYVSINASKQASADGAHVYLDGLGWRVTFNVTCGGPEDTVVTVPLTDEYDSTLFEFVSADPAPDSVTTDTSGDTYNPADLINWSNLGPLYAGQTKTVTVTLKALEHSSNPQTTTNYARVRNAEFANGSPVNNGDANDDVDLNPAGTIGDLVWNDIDGDGAYEPNGADSTPNTADDELGFAGVTVYLCTSTPCNSGTAGVLTTITDANGNYLFEAVRDGASYYVVVDTVTLPSGASNTHDRDGNNDSVTAAMTINNTDVPTTNDDIADADFGYTIPTLIEGSIWHDYNQSATGTPDDGEEGLASVWVYVSDGSCTYTSPGTGTCPMVQTDSNGDFEIDLTAAGWNPGAAGTTYTVIVDDATLPTGSWTQSYDTPNGPDGLPGTGDDTVALNHSVPVTVVSGGQGRADYSYYQTGTTSITGTVYSDWNGDATQDTGDDGFENVTVYLYEDNDGDGVIDPEDALIATTLTNSSGDYTFSNLPGDDYIVLVDESDPDLPSDYQQTEDPDVGNGTPCSGAACDADGSADTSGGSVSNVDFGYQPVGYGSIGDYVWQDDDADGLQDSGESALPNISVDLYVWEDDGDGILEAGEQGALISTTASASDGSYLFGDLPAGNYIVDVDDNDTDIPTDANSDPYVVSSTYDHDDNLTTADVNNDPMGVSLSDGENYLDADFGFAAPGSIGDFVWQDNDGDGMWDTNEPGISNVTVTLYRDNDGDGVQSVGDTQFGSSEFTDSNGYYLFTGIPAGDYVVVVTTPGAYSLTGDPDAYATGATQPYPPYDPAGTYAYFDGEYGTSLLGGGSDLAADFGYQPQGVLGDTVWIDSDNNNVRDAEELGIPNVTVWLCTSTPCNSGSADQTTTTDESGEYSFGNLTNGQQYYIAVNSGDIPVGLTQTFGTSEQTRTIDTGTNNGVDLTVDFGYRFAGNNSVSGTAYHDDNNDADQDTGETTTYSDVPVYLYYCGADVTCGNSDDVLAGSILTDASGNYTFGNLADGFYRVIVNTNATSLRGADPTVTGSATTSRDVD